MTVTRRYYCSNCATAIDPTDADAIAAHSVATCTTSRGPERTPAPARLSA